MNKLDFVTTSLHLFHGAAFVLVVVYLIGLLRPFLPSEPVAQRIFVGLLYGIATVVGMAVALQLGEGIIFDARSVILGVGSAFGGPIVGAVAGVVASAYRLYVGGVGVFVGISVIAASVLIGCVFYYLGKAGHLERRFFEFLGFGFVLHVVALLCFSFIPGMTLKETMNIIGLPVLATFTPATAILCSMVWSQISRDALEHQAAERDVRERSLFEDSPVAQVSVSAKDCTLLAFNAAMKQLTGYADGELRGMKIFELYADTPDGKERAKELFEKFKRGDPLLGERLKLRRKNGDYRFIRLSVNPVTGEDGSVVESRSALVDVSPLVEAEHAMEASHRRLSLALDQIQDAIVLYDNARRISFANVAFLDLTGRSLDELVGRRDKETWPPDVYSQYIGYLEQAFDTGKIVVAEISQSFRKDDPRNLLVVMHPVIDADGRVVEVMMTIDDQTELLRAAGETVQLEIQRKTLEKSLYKVLLDTIGAIALTVEKRDPYTAGHQTRVARLSVAIAAKMGWDEHRIEGLRLGAMIHDMGKIYVPSEILNRPGKLTDDEFNIIKSHPKVGEEIISAINFPWPVAQMVSQHHERIDGSGYPEGLTGPEIVDEAKIIAVADVVEAITSHRPYRPAIGIEKGLAEIENGRGTRFDPAIVDVCVELIREEGFTFG